MNFGPTELIIILLIVVLLFGVGRLSKLGKDMGSGIREFRKGLQGDEDPNKPQDPTQTKSGDDANQDQGSSQK